MLGKNVKPVDNISLDDLMAKKGNFACYFIQQSGEAIVLTDYDRPLTPDEFQAVENMLSTGLDHGSPVGFMKSVPRGNR